MMVLSVRVNTKERLVTYQLRMRGRWAIVATTPYLFLTNVMGQLAKQDRGIW